MSVKSQQSRSPMSKIEAQQMSDRALDYYKQAADQMKKNSRSVNVASAIELLHKSAELGLDEARYQLGVLYAEGRYCQQDLSMASDWFTLAAESGFVPAKFALATLYRHEDKHHQATELLIELAEQGVMEAKTNLADCYLEAKGVDKDVAKGIELLQQAANAGDRFAQYRLGVIYYQGKEVPTDYIFARKNIVLAMEQKYLPAYLVMGAMLEHGFGINKDVIKAYSLYFFCDYYGMPNLKELLSDVLFTLNDIEKQQAKQRAEEWCQNEPAPV